MGLQQRLEELECQGLMARREQFTERQVRPEADPLDCVLAFAREKSAALPGLKGLGPTASFGLTRGECPAGFRRDGPAPGPELCLPAPELSQEVGGLVRVWRCHLFKGTESMPIAPDQDTAADGWAGLCGKQKLKPEMQALGCPWPAWVDQHKLITSSRDHGPVVAHVEAFEMFLPQPVQAGMQGVPARLEMAGFQSPRSVGRQTPTPTLQLQPVRAGPRAKAPGLSRSRALQFSSQQSRPLAFIENEGLQIEHGLVLLLRMQIELRQPMGLGCGDPMQQIVPG